MLIPRLFALAVLVHASSAPLVAAGWFGNVDSNFENAENWRDANAPDEVVAPQANLENKTSLVIVNGGGLPLVYTEANGETSFTEQLLVGANAGPTGELRIEGGTLNASAAIIGQTVEGKVILTGGALNL